MLGPRTCIYEMTGGPREGRGGAVRDAMRAAATGCRTCAILLGFSDGTAQDVKGTATVAHKGQSMLEEVWALSDELSSVPATTIFIPPALVQTICVSVGFKMGEAMAAPMNNANHTSTQRAIVLCVATLSMWRIIAEAKSLFSQAP